VARALAYAPYADLIWVETATPDLGLARRVAEAVHAQFPGKMLAYNCSPSFNWKAHLTDEEIAVFQRELGALGYKFQFITLAGFHQLNYGMFELAHGYAREGMTAYVDLQEKEFAAEARGYTATRHQREVGTGYFDLVSTTLNPQSDTLALRGSTEEARCCAQRPAPPPRGAAPARARLTPDLQGPAMPTQTVSPYRYHRPLTPLSAPTPPSAGGEVPTPVVRRRRRRERLPFGLDGTVRTTVHAPTTPDTEAILT